MRQIKKYKKKRLFLTGQRSVVGWSEDEYRYSVIKIIQRLFKKKKRAVRWQHLQYDKIVQDN